LADKPENRKIEELKSNSIEIILFTEKMPVKTIGDANLFNFSDNLANPQKFYFENQF